MNSGLTGSFKHEFDSNHDSNENIDSKVGPSFSSDSKISLNYSDVLVPAGRSKGRAGVQGWCVAMMLGMCIVHCARLLLSDVRWCIRRLIK